MCLLTDALLCKSTKRTNSFRQAVKRKTNSVCHQFFPAPIACDLPAYNDFANPETCRLSPGGVKFPPDLPARENTGRLSLIGYTHSAGLMASPNILPSTDSFSASM